MEKIIIAKYINWHFFGAARDIFQAWRNFLWFGINYFSVGTLIKTYFSHWHRYRSAYGKKLDFQKWVETFTFNMMSRVIGAMLRTFLILGGIIFELLIFFAGIIVLFLWLALPFIIVLNLGLALRLLI